MTARVCARWPPSPPSRQRHTPPPLSPHSPARSHARSPVSPSPRRGSTTPHHLPLYSHQAAPPCLVTTGGGLGCPSSCPPILVDYVRRPRRQSSSAFSRWPSARHGGVGAALFSTGFVAAATSCLRGHVASWIGRPTPFPPNWYASVMRGWASPDYMDDRSAGEKALVFLSRSMLMSSAALVFIRWCLLFF
jgi:hypothetical protein